MTNPRKTTALGKADVERVQKAAQHLIEAFNAYINQPEIKTSITYVDAMMAAHNFHAAIIADLVDRTGNWGWYETAQATFEKRMQAGIAEHKQ